MIELGERMIKIEEKDVIGSATLCFCSVTVFMQAGGYCAAQSSAGSR